MDALRSRIEFTGELAHLLAHRELTRNLGPSHVGENRVLPSIVNASSLSV
jgi:hypothetical protein